RRGRGRTTTANVAEALNGGSPSSVTCTMIWFVVLLSALDGVHVKTPVITSISALAGALSSRLKLKASSASGSLAELVNVIVVPAWTVRSAMDESTGGLFGTLGRTVTENVAEALLGGSPLSVTRIVMYLVVLL